MKRITIHVSAKPNPTSASSTIPKPEKIIIAPKKKIPNPVIFAICPDASIAGLKTAINQHIGTMKLQTEQKLYVVIDDWLSEITGFETESVHKIVEIHEHAIKNMYITGG